MAGAGEAGLWRWLPAGPFANVAQFADEMAPFVGSAAQPTLFIAPEGGGSCGFAAFWRIDRAHGTAEIGKVLFAPPLQRTTAATEALVLMLRHAFGHGYSRVEWKCDSRNARSRAAAGRLGFAFEGRFRKHTIVKGDRRDTDWLAIIDEDWLRLDRAWTAWLDPANFDSAGRQRRPLSALAAAGPLSAGRPPPPDRRPE